MLKKAAYVPVRDMPYYALRYAGHRLRKLTHRESRLPTWGPTCGKLSQWCAELSTQEVCLRQWNACVERATDSLGRVPRQQVHFVRYENVVTQPLLEMSRMCNFLGIHPQQTMLTVLTKTLYCDSVGKGVPADPTVNRQVLTDLVRDTLDRVHRMWPDERLGATKAA